MAPKVIKAIYIGDKFYHESKTMMSSIYLENGWRYDYGKLQCDLANGHEIHIRPATPMEMQYFEEKLEESKNTF